MKRCVITLTALVLFAGAAFAGPPLDGTYQSTDIGGTIPAGRYSESFLAPNGAIEIGTVLNAASFDGALLGNLWTYKCAVIQTPSVVLTDLVNPTTGTGSRTYMKTFIGGHIWLNGSGPWGNGDAGYAGPIDTYVEFETVQYVEWERVHAVTNVQAQAHFNNYPSACVAFSVANGHEIGSTDFGMTLPANFPELLNQTTCLGGEPYGAWWELHELSLVISGCTTPSEEHTWGSVKQLYR